MMKRLNNKIDTRPQVRTTSIRALNGFFFLFDRETARVGGFLAKDTIERRLHVAVECVSVVVGVDKVFRLADVDFDTARGRVDAAC